MRWATIDKEGFAIVSTFRRPEHFLWNGVHIFTDRRNLAYIFDPEACVTSVSEVFLASIGTQSVTFRVTVTRGATCCRAE